MENVIRSSHLCRNEFQKKRVLLMNAKQWLKKEENFLTTGAYRWEGLTMYWWIKKQKRVETCTGILRTMVLEDVLVSLTVNPAKPEIKLENWKMCRLWKTRNGNMRDHYNELILKIHWTYTNMHIQHNKSIRSRWQGNCIILKH